MPFDDWQARADTAPTFLNVILCALGGAAGFSAGLTLGGHGRQYAFGILTAAIGFYFLRLFVMFLRYAIMITILAAIAWAGWFVWHVYLDHP